MTITLWMSRMIAIHEETGQAYWNSDPNKFLGITNNTF